MSAHLPIVALELRILGWALGAPAFLSTLCLSIGALALRRAPAIELSPSLDIQTYGLVGLLSNGARGVVMAMEFIAHAAAWALGALAVASSTTLMIAVMVYLTGRGIQHHAMWARVLGVLLFLGLLAFGLGALPVLPRWLAAVDALAIGAALYSLWVLAVRFN